jgi:acetyltransferase-like isoleucine patch superfamily enzyme
MIRDFSHESIVNFLFRVSKGISNRIRGRLFVLFLIFNKKSSFKISIDKGVRLINSKQILFSENVSLGKNSRIEVFNTIEYSAKDFKIFFDSNTSFGDNFHCGSIDQVYIGKNVLGGSNILITDHSHGKPKADIHDFILIPPVKRTIESKGPVIIEDNVWIGDGVVILSGLTIGEGSIISANSVVRKDVPKRTIFFGK